VTGGAGFIGSNFILEWMATENEKVVNLDALTYAGNISNLESLLGNELYIFEQGDICDAGKVADLLTVFRPRAIINFAAESHVDRSIAQPAAFIQTNVVGTFQLLECSRSYLNSMSAEERTRFRFLHVSTDEVYGTLKVNDAPFTESHCYSPNSPYSASKASADHLVRAYYQTYGLPVMTTNCSNNYGPFQFPEKLIPLVICKALSLDFIPLYGDGQQIRDWLFVGDHCAAIKLVLSKGEIGEVYNIGGRSEKTNLDLMSLVCDILNEKKPRSDGKRYSDLITSVDDRPGHDRRYAVDITKITRELGWQPRRSLETGIEMTIDWYLANLNWVEKVVSGSHRKSR
jgi:dTDP-glucose 4,6-dehydratase